MCLLEAESRDAVVEGLRPTGVDVDAALDTGSLTFHTVEETYLRDGQFDPDDMVEFYADVIDEATREYEGLRIAASVGWLLEEATSTADFMAYESKVNDLFHGEDCIALCQYDRSRFPAAVLETVIQTHPTWSTTTPSATTSTTPRRRSSFRAGPARPRDRPHVADAHRAGGGESRPPGA